MTVILSSILILLYLIGVIVCCCNKNTTGLPARKYVVAMIVFCMLVPLPMMVGALSVTELVTNVILKLRKKKKQHHEN